MPASISLPRDVHIAPVQGSSDTAGRDATLEDAYEIMANAYTYTLVLLCDLDEPELEYTFQEPCPPRAIAC